VRRIGSEWRNLAEGLLRVEDLEAQFRIEYGPRLEEAFRARNAAEVRRLKRRGHITLVAASVLALFLFVVALLLLLLSPPTVPVVLVLALVIPAVLVLYGVWALLHTPAPLPDPSGLCGRWRVEISGRGALSVKAPAPLRRRDATGTWARRLSRTLLLGYS